MRLVFGVLDIPYKAYISAPVRKAAAAARKKAGAPKRAPAPLAGHTTGDVAEILEAQYHVMEHFWEAHSNEIAEAMADDVQDFLQTRISEVARGKAVDFTAAQSAIQTMFNQFIDSQEMDGLGYPGIPTMASLKGVNHRLKHPYAKGNPPRPSFKDSGLYEQSFRAKVEE